MRAQHGCGLPNFRRHRRDERLRDQRRRARDTAAAPSTAARDDSWARRVYALYEKVSSSSGSSRVMHLLIMDRGLPCIPMRSMDHSPAVVMGRSRRPVSTGHLHCVAPLSESVEVPSLREEVSHLFIFGFQAHADPPCLNWAQRAACLAA